ncbi:MAG: PAS domain S-box protein, partial [Candidatus Paceibacterota bacterium]
MFKFFQKLRKHFFSSQLLVFWFFGGILITQIVFNFFWVDWPLNLIISLGLSAFYSVIGIILLNAVDSAERLNMERNQINAIIGSIDDPAISYGQNFEIVLVNGAMEKFLGLNKKELIGKIITPEL